MKLYLIIHKIMLKLNNQKTKGEKSGISSNNSNRFK